MSSSQDPVRTSKLANWPYPLLHTIKNGDDDFSIQADLSNNVS